MDNPATRHCGRFRLDFTDRKRNPPLNGRSDVASVSNTLFVKEFNLKFFLNAKAWQMFLVLVVSMFGSQTLMPLFNDPTIGILLGTLVLMALYMGWLLSIALKANQKLDASLKKSPKGMVVGLAYAASYLIGALILLPGSVEPGRSIPGFLIPMHLLAMAAIFYALLFTAKRLVTLERNEAVGFFEYSGPFFLLWFFPIGVWFVQPRVNRLLGGGT